MTLKIAVIGASGVYGRHLVPRLVARDHHVRALVRRPDKAAALAALGVELRAADIFDAASLRAGLEGCDIAVNLATAVPKPGEGASFAMNDRLRREGAPVLAEGCIASGVGRLLQQSIAMVHSGTVAGDGFADESAPVLATASAVDMERAVTQSSLDWIILRGGLFYGPGTGHEDHWRAEARAGRLMMPGDGESFVSLVHIADMAAATVLAIEKWPSRQVMLVADDRPVRWRELFTYVAARGRAAAAHRGTRAGLLRGLEPQGARDARLAASIWRFPSRISHLARIVDAGYLSDLPFLHPCVAAAASGWHSPIGEEMAATVP